MGLCYIKRVAIHFYATTLAFCHFLAYALLQKIQKGIFVKHTAQFHCGTTATTAAFACGAVRCASSISLLGLALTLRSPMGGA